MHTGQFVKRLEKNRQLKTGFDYSFGKELQLDDFILVEKKLDINIPQRIKDFFFIANGLKTANPTFELVDLTIWKMESGLIHFATFNNSNKVYFKTSELNQAGEWTIYNKDADYEITFTIASFWSNKIWHWIEQNKRIWSDNWWEN